MSPWAQLRDLRREITELRDHNFLWSQPEAHRDCLLDLLPKSNSQVLQDLFVLSRLGFKRDGFFVEFGACDGVSGSNTLLLENQFGWHGVLAEPARVWHDGLRANRRALVSTKCVWSRSGETLMFNQADMAGLSTIASFSEADRWACERLNGDRYAVETICSPTPAPLGGWTICRSIPRAASWRSSRPSILRNIDFRSSLASTTSRRRVKRFSRY
jgi:hypothetical protein